MTQGLSGRLIGLSAGGKPRELADQGLGIEHVEELMVRLSMKLLRGGYRLAFGGTLGNPEAPLTEFLIDTAQNWLDEASAKQSDVTQPETWPLTNYGAWPFYWGVSDEQRAELVGICRFVDVNPNGIPQADLTAAAKDWHANPQARLYVADALTAMRQQAARETTLQIVWGGTIAGAKGWMSGILEEVAFSLENGKPVLVLGGFGGCARLLAGFLADTSASWPNELSLAACADVDRDKLHQEPERRNLVERFGRAKVILEQFRTKIHSDDIVNGVSSELMREALLEETARRVVSHAVDAARSCCRSR